MTMPSTPSVAVLLIPAVAAALARGAAGLPDDRAAQRAGGAC